MPRPTKPPRLYVRHRADRGPSWVILDAGDEIGTGCGLDDRPGAEAALARYLARKHRPQIGITSPQALPVADVLTYYLQEKAPADDADARRLKAHVNLTINVERLLEWWGNKTLEEVKRSSCKLYVAHRQSQPNRSYKDPAAAPRVSASMARRELEDLRAAIGAYHAEWTLDAVPVVTLPEKHTSRKRWLTRREAALMLWACLGWRHDPQTGRLAKIANAGIRKQVRTRRRHLSRFVLIGLYSGTRHMPIVRARWVASPSEPYIDVGRGVLFRRGEDERKTKKQQPPARIVPRLMVHLRRWAAADDAKGVTHVLHMNGRVLTAQIRTAWEGARGDAGLGRDVVPHVLRHTSVTWTMQGGANVNDAAGFFGMSEQTLRDNYWHHHPDYQDSVDGSFARSRERSATAPRIAQETPDKTRTKRGQIIKLGQKDQ